MDALPLEMKERICGFFYNSPKQLKPIRLISKSFANAAAKYLMPRIFLCKHSDSFAEVKAIADHPIFCKHVTTLVINPSVLKNHPDIESWIDDHDHLRDHYPDWWDYKPGDVDYDSDGDPLLSTSRSRAKWMLACKAFDKAASRVTKQLKKSQEGYWKAYQEMFAKQFTAEFQRGFLDTIAYAFKKCPILTNVVVAPPQPHQMSVIAKLFNTFQAMHPHLDAWVESQLHDPSEFGVAELLKAVKHQKAGLNSMTIVDFPFKCADYFEIGSLESFKNLKHIRIGYNGLRIEPKGWFGFNLEIMIKELPSLETLWMETPPIRNGAFDADEVIQAISSKCFRDILLNNVNASEDVLVDFLLHHSSSLQQLDLGMTLISGTWASVFRRVSCQMRVLERMQIPSIYELHDEDRIAFSPKWCSRARDYVLNGGELPEREPYEEDDFLEYADYHERTPRRHDQSEDGLWSDYEARVNVMY